MASKADLQARIDEFEAVSPCFCAVRSALPQSLDELTVWQAAKAAVALQLAKELDSITTGEGVRVGPPPNVAAIAKQLSVCIGELETDLGGDDDEPFFTLPADVGNSA